MRGAGHEQPVHAEVSAQVGRTARRRFRRAAGSAPSRRPPTTPTTTEQASIGAVSGHDAERQLVVMAIVATVGHPFRLVVVVARARS
jgi:hypothetical protein